MTLSQLVEVQAIIREVTGYAAFIAGGAVRDLRLGLPIKDIDVFIPRSRDEDVYEHAPQAYDAGRVAKALQSELVTTSESGYPDGEQVYATYEVQYGTYPTINLIFVEEAAAALNEFPDTLAQAFLDDLGTPVYSAGFEETVRTGTIVTRLPEDNKRIQRLSGKLLGYSWKQSTMENWA